MTTGFTWGLALLFGIGSSIIPILNAEAFAIGAASASLLAFIGAVVLLSTGQSLGKLFLFTAARLGMARSKRLAKVASSKHAVRVMSLMDTPRRAGVTVFASATLGLPPLAVVSVAAGTTKQAGLAFFVICLSGRLLRFSFLAAPFLALGGLPFI